MSRSKSYEEVLFHAGLSKIMLILDTKYLRHREERESERGRERKKESKNFSFFRNVRCSVILGYERETMFKYISDI